MKYAPSEVAVLRDVVPIRTGHDESDDAKNRCAFHPFALARKHQQRDPGPELACAQECDVARRGGVVMWWWWLGGVCCGCGCLLWRLGWLGEGDAEGGCKGGGIDYRLGAGEQRGCREDGAHGFESGY